MRGLQSGKKGAGPQREAIRVHGASTSLILVVCGRLAALAGRLEMQNVFETSPSWASASLSGILFLAGVGQGFPEEGEEAGFPGMSRK